MAGGSLNQAYWRKSWLLLACLILPISLWAADSGGTPAPSGKILKWVDSKGVTHYGDTLPPEYTNNNAVISNHGVLLKRNDGKAGQVELSEQDLEKQRYDRALLASYTSAEEIDLARDRRLQTDQVIIQGLEQRRITAGKQLATHLKFAEGFQKRKKPLPDDLVQDINDVKKEIASIDKQSAQLKENIAATKSKFEADKQRFIVLKSTQK